VGDGPRYSLALSDDEVQRYRMMAQMARSTEAEAWERAWIVSGARIVDLGCGPGLVTVELAAIAGPDGAVVGVDREPSALAAARALLAEGSVTNARVVEGLAWDTGLGHGAFDVVNMRHVLAHNTADDQHRILQHAYDLLVPAGSLYVVDSDVSTGRIDPPEADLLDLFATYARHLVDTGRNAGVGPMLGSMAMEAGFELVERGAIVNIPPPAALRGIRPPPWAARDAMIESGHATPADVERWDRAIVAFQAHPNPAVFVTNYSVIARKPERSRSITGAKSAIARSNTT
jgi:ubiquinone/menaquinone biosynthesis C-methylase UbiE